MSLSSIVLGYSINNDLYMVASIGILAFVVSFATGLGPVPFVLLGELPKEEVSQIFRAYSVRNAPCTDGNADERHSFSRYQAKSATASIAVVSPDLSFVLLVSFA